MPVVVPTTWNPSDKGASVTLTNGNLTAATTYSGSVRSIFGATSGKFYFEVTATAGPDNALVGVGTAAAKTSPSPAYPGIDANGYAVYWFSGAKYNNGASSNYYAGAIAVGAVVGVKLDLDNLTISYVIGGVDRGVAFNLPAGQKWYAMFGGGSSSTTPDTVLANFGASAFTNAVPSGFYAGFGIAYTISGKVTDDTAAATARTVRAYRRSDGVLQGSATSDAATGNYTVQVPTNDECSLIVLDDAAGTVYNDLIARVIPA